jgi:hypothetical protein
MRKIIYLSPLVLIFILLAGCSGDNNVKSSPDSPESSLVITSSETDNSVELDTSLEVDTVQESPVNYCLECHANQELLMENVDPNAGGNLIGVDWATGLPDLEMWQKVLVDSDRFISTVHGQFPCTSCHGGAQAPDKATAHEGLIQNPSQGPEVVCGECHPDVEGIFHNSLHATVEGFWSSIAVRSLPSDHPELRQALNDNCSTCHNTCGDCHVSQPRSVGGGLLEGHLFVRNPSMELSCNSCHGSRIGMEFMGNHENNPADVHFQPGNMNCMDCHTSNELHGEPANCNTCHQGPENVSVPPPDHRFDDVQNPRCESCHTVVSTGQDEVIMHQIHGAELSCQVCHSVAYTNCEGCHVAPNGSTYTLEANYPGFIIGRNPIQTYERPYRYVTLRHVPVTPDTFKAYGDNLLANFDKRETWKYAVPHNIQRNTPQAESCNSCHNNPDLFLTADKVAPDELEANRNVIMEEIPPLISSAEQIPDLDR